ncbi:cellulose biosynthesis protein BcsS [Salinarimonas soli]|uniref:Cellulose biosynthesis protein BcsS n=1 Tax=Salinarimonas soli TaxID=1638099 RepID=A0A5B2VJ00_9HYPH|nr:cellulose biosynthesis protein BcsS [Salinarimonas soli]KAA2238177.1 cellulose biosynthesis protein BcsS [Salinarimonas soli]
MGPAQADEAHSVFFAGLDAGHSLHAHIGFKQALTDSLDRSGFVAMGILGAGGRKRDGDHPLQLGLLGGYQWAMPRIHAALFLGPEGERDGGLRLGVRAQGEIWARPSDETLLTATLIAGSARPQAWGRVSAGYKAWDETFVGPELSLKRERDWTEWRAGVHVTGPTFAGVTWRVSAGRSFAEGGREGFYGGLSGHIRFGGP